MPKFLRARPPLDDGEAGKIRRLAGARHAPAGWAERARIVALSWGGLAVPAIAGQFGCHPNKVRRWLHRFNAEGIGGLGDRPGAGRRRRITGARRSAIIALARSEPPRRLARDADGELSAEREDGPAQWTPDTLARAARDAGIVVGRSQVRRIPRAEKVRRAVPAAGRRAPIRSPPQKPVPSLFRERAHGSLPLDGPRGART